MKHLSAILIILFIVTPTFGLTVEVGEYIYIGPTNASNYGISFEYFHPVPPLVTIQMPYTMDEASFDEAILAYSSGEQHFKIPIYGKMNDNGNLTLAFWMDLATLYNSTITVRFEKEGDIIGRVFMFICKDFVPVQKVSQQGGPAYPPQGVGSADP